MASPSKAGAALTALRGGGHSVAGTALNDGGLVVDLRHMRAVTVDPTAEAVRVAGGATMSDLDRACPPHGPATTGGRASTTGVGGFVLERVTADGTRLARELRRRPRPR